MNDALFARMQELRDLSGLIGLATWDQETYLPKKADVARAAQLSTLQGLYHERLIDPKVADWLDDAAPKTADETAMVRVLRRERERSIKIPAQMVKALAEAQSLALSAWRAARVQKNFQVFRPHLERLVKLRREQADAYGHDGERYDALLESYEPAMRVKRLDPVLNDLKKRLVPIVQRIDAAPKPRDIFAGKSFNVDEQWRFTFELLQSMGFDLDAGRQDKSTHPFTGGTHLLDVRLTTRLFPETPLPALFGTIHEGGHGLYEQGFDPAHARTTLAQSPSMGLHESQSRLWENVVGRSHSFWTHFFPNLQHVFSAELNGVSIDEFVRAVNRVERSLIRVEADEVTYNLHIVLRYELELGLIRGTLDVADVEAAWNEKMKAFFDLTVSNPTEGVLQDIHWAWGEFGYFPTYTLGNLYSASLWNALSHELPTVMADVARGDLLPICDWLKTKIHREGYRMEAEDLVKRVTGRGLTDTDFVSYLVSKYEALYGISLATSGS